MNKLTVSYAPHIHDNSSARRIMLDVIIALVPAFAMSVWVFGSRAAVVTSVCVVSCVLMEGVYQKLMKKPVTVNDFSAIITGLLLAFNLPVDIPIWQAVFGCAVAIIFVKQLFGGLGKNFANPAVTARVVMFLAFSTSMTTWAEIPDAASSATPLALMKRGGEELEKLPELWNMIIGSRGGSLGETSALVLLIGGIYLLVRRVITWHTPVTFIATVFILTALLGEKPEYHLFAGGLFLGAIFMATDYPTTPQTSSGRLIFGAGCGVLTVLIRLYGNYPEGVAFSILLMNMVVPYINKLTARKALGGKRD
ncbi:MAG: RnfABCDGE type electron transport complex subunit D [Oscillospiraceae bacterium]|nr:RnfABCDGE type electron transport complex subunit D [Oscillospiraceae bacterium]